MPHREECYESCDCPENKTCSRCGGIGAHINYCQYLEVDLSPDTDAAGINFKELNWGKTPNLTRLEMGPRSKEHAKEIRSSPDYTPVKRISEFERHSTPPAFRDLLIELVR